MCAFHPKSGVSIFKKCWNLFNPLRVHEPGCKLQVVARNPFCEQRRPSRELVARTRKILTLGNASPMTNLKCEGRNCLRKRNATRRALDKYVPQATQLYGGNSSKFCAKCLLN